MSMSNWWERDATFPVMVDTLANLPVGSVIGFPIGPCTGILTVYELAVIEDGTYWLSDGFPEPISDHDLPAVLLWRPDWAGV